MNIALLKKLIRERITNEYRQEFKKDARLLLKQQNTINEIAEAFPCDCYELARSFSGIMDITL